MGIICIICMNCQIWIPYGHFSWNRYPIWKNQKIQNFEKSKRGTKNTQKWLFFKNNAKFEFLVVILAGIDTPYEKLKKIKILKKSKRGTKNNQKWLFFKNDPNLNSPWSFQLAGIDTPYAKIKNFKILKNFKTEYFQNY